MRRFFGLVSALAVSFFAVLPVSAWDQYSFTGDSFAYYDFMPVMSSSASVYSGDSSVNTLDFYHIFSNVTPPVLYLVTMIDNIIGDIPVRYPESGYVVSSTDVTGNNKWYYYDVSISDETSSGDVNGVLAPWFSAEPEYDIEYASFTFPLDISPLGSFSSFEVFGGLYHVLYVYHSSGILSIPLSSLTIYVDGVAVRTFSFFDNALTHVIPSYIYNSSVPVSNISIELSYRLTSIPMDTYRIGFYFWGMPDDDSYFHLTSLSGSAINDAVNDAGQDAIDEEDALQSEWGGSMVENFNNLNVGSFTYPSGLTSAFSLVSGIFQDVWYAFDDYAILWVFPLTLAILLLVVGRLSKFAGRSSQDGGDG